MSLYYEPCSRITVGSLVFNNVNKVEISESVTELGDKATIVLPRQYKELLGKGVLDYIKTGDKVTIELGTDASYNVEFTGYLGQIESDAPLVLHCDDNFYPYKRNKFNKSWAKVTLKELLTYIFSGFTIDCPDVEFGQFQIANASSYEVIRAVCEQYGFYARMYNNTIRCYWAFEFATNNVWNYKIGNNVKKNNLKYNRAEDVKLKIKGISNLRNGKKLTYEHGSIDPDATLRTRNYNAITTDELKKAVIADYKRFCFDGFTGTITGYAFPRTHAGDTLNIIDDNEPDRAGKYLIEKTTIRYDVANGFERENTLSFKV